MKSRIAVTGSFLAGISIALSATIIAGPVTLPNSFTANTTARASEVNANFTAIKAAVDDNHTRLGTVEATVTRLTGMEATVNRGNIVLGPSTTTSGNIFKGPDPFVHNFGSNNAFLGVNAGNFMMTGGENTAVGADALRSNMTGIANVAIGRRALNLNTTGVQNIAIGKDALVSNTVGENNTASGFAALLNNTTGVNNTAMGVATLAANQTGVNNIAIGVNALVQSSGNNNIGIGVNAGSLLQTGNDNIYIGSQSVTQESRTIRIGTAGKHDTTYIAGIGDLGIVDGMPVYLGRQGQLGVGLTSSIKVKDHVADMADASRVLSQLRPVTFHYKSDKGSPRLLQYGLIAEEVAKVAPGLVAHDAKGEIQAVYYQFLAPMLLNEYQKQRRLIEAQATEIAALERHHEAQLARISALEDQAARTAALLSRVGQAVTTSAAAR